jgi:hypothetical protein
VHIITAYNPAGVEIDAGTNGPLHQALGNALEPPSDASAGLFPRMSEPRFYATSRASQTVVSDLAIALTWRRSEPQQPPNTFNHGRALVNWR